VEASTVLAWIVFGSLSGGSIIYLCRKIGVGIPWLSVICLAVAFHFWPIWYWRTYRPAKRRMIVERAAQFRHDNWAAVEAARW
jgi:hypothetical protein